MTKQRKTEAIWIEAQTRWRVRVTHEGKTKAFYSSTPGRKGKAEAERSADKWLDEGGSDNPRFEALWNEYLENLASTHKERKKAPHYIKTESLGRLYLLPKLKLRRVLSITLQDWQDCINIAYAKGLSYRSCTNVRGAVTAFYAFARKNRVKMEAPEFLTVPRDAPKGQRSILQPNEIKHLFSVDWITHYRRKQESFFIHAWRFLVLTGLRRGELCGLRKEDVLNGVLYIRRAINSLQQETAGKNDNAVRYIVLSGRMQAILDAQDAMLKQRGIITPWIFPDETGACLDSNHLYKKWSTYRDQHNLKCSLHELRHTMISIVKSDVPDALLKSVVGHSKSMDTKGVYGHPVDDDARRATNLIDDVFDRIFTE